MASAGGSINDRILALLAEAGSPLDDDQIAARIGVVRQQVNDRCRPARNTTRRSSESAR